MASEHMNSLETKTLQEVKKAAIQAYGFKKGVVIFSTIQKNMPQKYHGEGAW